MRLAARSPAAGLVAPIALALLVSLGACGHESDTPSGRRPNLLIVSIDTLRADHLGAYGYPRKTSPYMSGELAARSTLFLHAVAPSTTTAPSHMTLLTSLPPSIHGVASNLRERGLPEGLPTMASVLQDAGYATAMFNENGAITVRGGFDRGFDEYKEFASANVLRPDGFVKEIFDAGVDFAERHPHEPWLVFLHTYEVHYPYTPRAGYEKLFPAGDSHNRRENRRLGRKHSDHYPVLYDREIRHTDDQLADLMHRLEASGYLENTYVVVTSDHGEAFFEHNFLGHGSDVHEETTRIPLFLFGPGIEGGRRIASPVGLIDLMPSLLELLGVEPPDGLMGRSFAPLLAGEQEAAEWEQRPIVSESWQPWGFGRKGRVDVLLPVLALRRGPHKLLRYKTLEGPRYELYDIGSDPHERDDLFGRGLAVEVELRELADGYEAGNALLLERLGLPALPTDTPSIEDISPDRIDTLRALGYIE